MSGLIDTLLGADAEEKLFRRGADWVRAGEIRRKAAGALHRMQDGDGAIFLHVSSAAHFTAGLLAAAASGRSIALPAHAQASYLAEIGCAPDSLLMDAAFEEDGDVGLLGGGGRDPMLACFTSGSTDAPKRVAKNLSRLEIEARALDTMWGAEAGHVVATVSHQHIYGLLFRIVWPLLSGRTSEDEAATYWEELEGRLAGASLVSSPAHLTRLPPRRDLFAPPPGLIFSSGQMLTGEAARACAAAFGRPVTEVLGSTETGGIAWRRQTLDEAWTPLPGVGVTQGEGGALTVRSPFLQDDAALQTGDAIELEGDGRFRLRPRGDRIVKVDGKRVSLTRVEAALTRTPEIEAAAALTLPARRDALAAVVVLSENGRVQLKAEGAFRLSRQLRAALAAALEPSERPKHWRFVEAIPVDTQGKRVASTLRTLFAAGDPLDALELDIQVKSETEADVGFVLPAELIFFQGHFPERAILPGVAQAHLAVLIAQKLWSGWRPNANLERLKFRRVLFPGDAVMLKLKLDAKSRRLSFTYMFGEIAASQGDLGGV